MNVHGDKCYISPTALPIDSARDVAHLVRPMNIGLCSSHINKCLVALGCLGRSDGYGEKKPGT